MSDRVPERVETAGQARMAQPIEGDPHVAPAGRSAVVAGALAGVLAGVVMAAYLVLAAVLQELEPFTALTPMGATFRDADALAGGAGTLLLGVSLHLGVSALVGVILALILPRDFTPGSSGFLAIGFALVVMGFMTSTVVPAVNPVLEESFHDLGGSWVLAHMLFGLTLGYAVQRLRQGAPGVEARVSAPGRPAPPAAAARGSGATAGRGRS